jgi:hypothetical protein
LNGNHSFILKITSCPANVRWVTPVFAPEAPGSGSQRWL